MGLTEYMPGLAFPAAPYAELARRVREASGLVTLQAARLSDPATADWAISAGCLDLAGMTRPQMADPDLVSKLMHGDEAHIRPCVGAGYCLDRIYAGRDAPCQHNISTRRKAVLPAAIPVADAPRRAVVVGGGPAGMEAARVLALRGHDVTLFEAQARLGGQILLAARGGWRKYMIGIADWLAGEIMHLGVDVRQGTYADADEVAAMQPDIVMIATGGVPANPLDADLPSVWDVLGGQVRAEGEVLIYDGVGEHAALSLADSLAGQGLRVTLITPDRHLGRGIGGQNVPVYLRNLARNGATALPDHSLTGVAQSGNKRVALLRNAYSRDTIQREADMIIADFGTDPVTEVFDALRPGSCNLGEVDIDALVAIAPQPMTANPAGTHALFRIGDALTPRDIHAVILDANRLARTL